MTDTQKLALQYLETAVELVGHLEALKLLTSVGGLDPEDE